MSTPWLVAVVWLLCAASFGLGYFVRKQFELYARSRNWTYRRDVDLTHTSRGVR